MNVLSGSASILIALSAGPLRADDLSAELDRWTRVYSTMAAEVRMSFSDGEAEAFALLEEPLLKYANPVRGVQQHGTIHLWMHAGRPAVVGSIWSRTSPDREDFRRVNFEWHTLVQRPVRAEYGGERIWATEQAGLEWRPLPGIPLTRSRPLRLLQMRRIAAGFDAEIERGESELRLLTQPLHRYAEDVPGAIDGAMFAFVMGTDPELFLLFEARDGEGEAEAGWHVGIVRFTNSGLDVRREGDPWWSCERFRAGPRDERYFLKFNVRELPTDLAGTEFETSSSDTSDTSDTSEKEDR